VLSSFSPSTGLLLALKVIKPVSNCFSLFCVGPGKILFCFNVIVHILSHIFSFINLCCWSALQPGTVHTPTVHKKAFRKSSLHIQNPQICGPTEKYAVLSKIANGDSFNNLFYSIHVCTVYTIGKITRDKQFADNSLQICESTKKLVDDNFAQMYVCTYTGCSMSLIILC
jgi:hypothetical protein